MTMVSRVLRGLEVGPATADELALEMGGNARQVSAVLHNLRDQGRVMARPYHAGGDRKQTGIKLLYSLPEHAR